MISKNKAHDAYRGYWDDISIGDDLLNKINDEIQLRSSQGNCSATIYFDEDISDKVRAYVNKSLNDSGYESNEIVNGLNYITVIWQKIEFEKELIEKCENNEITFLSVPIDYRKRVKIRLTSDGYIIDPSTGIVSKYKE